MPYKGVLKEQGIALEGDTTLPEGMRVRIIPELSITVTVPQPLVPLQEWLHHARQVRTHLPRTSDAVEILRQLREERAHR